MDLPKMATLKEASELTGLSYWCIRAWCQQGKVISVTAGKKVLVNLNSLAKFLNNEV